MPGVAISSVNVVYRPAIQFMSQSLLKINRQSLKFNKLMQGVIIRDFLIN